MHPATAQSPSETITAPPVQHAHESEERHLFVGVVRRLDHLANLVGKIGNGGKRPEVVITTAPGIANGDAFDIAGKGFGEGNVKLCRSPGMRKDVELRWLPSHAATIQSPTCPSGQGAARRSARLRLNDVQLKFKSCEKAMKWLCRLTATRFPDSAIAERKKSLRFLRHHVWQSL